MLCDDILGLIGEQVELIRSKKKHEQNMGQVFHQMLNKKQYEHFPKHLDNSIGQDYYFDDILNFFYEFNENTMEYELRSNYKNCKMVWSKGWGADEHPWWYDDFVEIAMYYDHDVIDMSRLVG